MTIFKSATQPLCRYCGDRIRKHAVTVYLKRERSEYDRDHPGFSRHIYTAEPIKSKADCEKQTNQTVIAVKWDRPTISTDTGYARAPDRDQIASFSEWDGESYIDQFFCNGDHAKRFAYVMARTGYQTQACANAIAAAKKMPA